MLKIGDMEYANVYPLFYHLKKRGDLKFVPGVPSYLNKIIREGGIDVAPCSSIEFARNAELYKIIPDISISCINEVKSVILFSEVPLIELSGKKIFLTSESNTSIVLLKILLSEFYPVNVGWTCYKEESSAHLLIGDSALREYYYGDAPYKYDLGQLWYEATGLPFVFALWIARKDSPQDELKQFTSILSEIKNGEANNHRALLEFYTEHGFTDEQMHDYWHTINYDLTEKHLEGLKMYFELAKKIGEIKEVPKLTFV